MASASEEEGDIEVVETEDDSPALRHAAAGPFDDDEGGGFAEHGVPSHHFGPFSPVNDSETEAASPVYASTHYVDTGGGNDDDSFAADSVETPTMTPNYTGVTGAAGFVSGFSADPRVAFSESGGESLAAKDVTFNEDFVISSSPTDGPILSPPVDVESEEGFLLREWKRQNAIHLQEKEKRERELVIQIREEADEYKLDFHRRWELNCQTRKANNREKEKLFVENQEKFHAEVDKNYWKAVAELIPTEVPNIEKRGKKEDKNPAVAVIHGPKPGKPTDLSRMRHILLKLKHSPPTHMKLPPSTNGIDIVPPSESKSSAATLSKD